MQLLRNILRVFSFNKRNWKAVLLCVFAASVFWMFNALNKTYTANLSFPLAFDYDEQSYVPVQPLPAQVRINVTGIGWNLLRRSIGLKIPPLVIPLERPADVRKIVGNTLSPFFANQVDGVEINSILTDTVYIHVEPRTGRWLTLAVDSVNKYLDDDHALMSAISLQPDSIFLTGPLTVVYSIKEPFIVTLPKRTISADFDEEVEIILPNADLIHRDPPLTRVSFSVDRLITVRDTITLQLINAPSRNILLENDKILMTARIPSKVRDHYNRDSVRAVLDLRNFRAGTKKIAPIVKGLPDHARVLRIDSVQVKLYP